MTCISKVSCVPNSPRHVLCITFCHSNYAVFYTLQWVITFIALLVFPLPLHTLHFEIAGIVIVIDLDMGFELWKHSWTSHVMVAASFHVAKFWEWLFYRWKRYVVQLIPVSSLSGLWITGCQRAKKVGPRQPLPDRFWTTIRTIHGRQKIGMQHIYMLQPWRLKQKQNNKLSCGIKICKILCLNIWSCGKHQI